MMNNIVLTDYPGHGTALLLMGVVTALSLFSFRTVALRSLPILRWILCALSSIVIFLLIVLTWNPSRVQMIERKEQNTLLVCFDTSESMSVINQSQSRMDQALAVFDRHLVKGRTDKPRCRWYGFDGDFGAISRKDIGKRWGGRSDLEAALTKLIDHVQVESRDGVNITSSICGAMIFTDGQADNKQVLSYPKWQHSDCPLVIVACGDSHPLRDVAVRTVKTPVSVNVEQRYDIVAQIAARNLEGQTVAVQLWINDILTDHVSVVMPEQGKQRDVHFSAHALTPGIDDIKVVAKAVDGEVNTRNNARTCLVKVLADNAVRAILYSQVASFDIGRVRQCLTQDARVRLDFLYDAIIDPKLQEDRADRLIRFPENAAEFNQYDLIVLGPCRFDQFSDEQIQGLYDFVTKGGGSVLFLAGRGPFGLEECGVDNIRALVPVEFNDFMNSDATHGLSITEEGRDQSYSEAICHESRANDIDVAYSRIRKKPAASAILQFGQKVLICIQRIGRGRTAIINSRNIYQLYREDKEDGPLFTLVSDIVTDVAGRPGRQSHIEVFVKRVKDAPDLIFEAFVTDQAYGPAQGATVLLEFDGSIMTMREAMLGTYMATIPSFQGNSVFARVRVEHRGLYLGEKSVTVELDDIRHEMDDTQCDKEFLRALCVHLGAEYADAGQIGPQTFDRFQSYRAGGHDRQLRRIWPRWWALALLCSILALQWFLRRAKGLI
ncbi:MAG TPA: hypothetical protein DIU00_23965 [Phycisphaerales bacterium]|nr:hypothetical protein [Phycisphaerales bacterium]